MKWDEKHECMPREELEKLQLRRLKDLCKRVYEKVPFYKKAFDHKKVKPEDIKSLSNLKELPFTVKTDLRDQYPFGLFAVPMKEVVRIHASSGTTGKPVVGGYTKNDLNMWAEVMARTLTSAGVSAADIIQNAYGYGLFTGGLGAHYGGERIGATVIPISGGLTERQIMLMKDFGSTVLCSTPSYALFMAEEALETGTDIRKLPLRVGVFGAEPWTEEMRKEVEEKMGIKAVDIYGLTEIIGPGVSAECSHRKGLHVFEDHFLPEIVDPVTLEPLPDGAVGELVFTTITKEALPLIRYRTRDICKLERKKCACGRTLARMARITGRSDDMLIIRGCNVYPSQVEAVLLTVKEVEPHYLLVIRREKNLDTMEVMVEGKKEVFTKGKEAVAAVEKKIREEIHQMIGLTAAVRLVEPKTIERSIGKAKRVLDERPK